jgi:hypothetical protein
MEMLFDKKYRMQLKSRMSCTDENCTDASGGLG